MKADEAVGRWSRATGRGNFQQGYQELTPGGVDTYTQNYRSEIREGDVSGFADQAAGGFDEAASDYAGGADVIAGSTDESLGRAGRAVSRGDVGGVGDAIAGTGDEAFYRAGAAARRGDQAGISDAAAGGVDEAASGVVGGTREWADAAGGSADETVRRTFDEQRGGGYGDTSTYRGGADELSGQVDEAVSRAAEQAGRGNFAAAGDQLVGGMDEGVSQIGQILGRDYGGSRGWRRAWSGAWEGDVGQTVGGLVQSGGAAYAKSSAIGDVAAGGTDEYVGSAQVDTGFTDRSTQSGGWLTEEQEQKLGVASQNFSEDAQMLADVATDYSPTAMTSEAFKGVTRDYGISTSATIAGQNVSLYNQQGEGIRERAIEGAISGGLGLGNVFSYASTAETGAEVAANAPQAARRAGPAATAATVTAMGRMMTGQAAQSITQNPARTLGGVGSEFVFGIGAGKVAGSLGRVTNDRLRTIGGEYVEPEGITNQDTVDYYEGQSQEKGDKFPGAESPERYRNSPAGTVRSQAERFTPSSVENFFRRYGVNQGTTLKKAIEVEPEGPGISRSPGKSTGFKTQKGDYESPGAFAGPEMSPNFLGIDPNQDYTPDFSLRPGLPSTGGNPTGVLVRTDVRNPEADTMDEFRNEMLERSGETTARTKPAGSDELNTGEIEAVIPPEAKFERVGNGLRGMLERVGIGSRFYTEIGGRRVPLRPVAPEDRGGPNAPDSPGDADAPQSGSGESLDYYIQEPSQPVDRSMPPIGAGGGAASQSQSGQPQQTYSSSPFGSIERDLQDLFGGGRRVTSGGRVGVNQQESAGDRGRGRGPSSSTGGGTDQTTRPDSPRDSGPSDTRPDGRKVPSDDELPDGWRRKKPGEYSSGRPRDRDRDGQPRDYGDSSRRNYGDRDRSRTTHPDDSSGSSRVSESHRRVTSGGGGSSVGSPTGDSEPTSPPTHNPPEIYPPPETYGPPSYGTLTPSGGPAEYESGGSTGGILYNPVLEYPNRPMRRDPDNEEEDKNPQAVEMPFGYWGKGWVNPVASAQEATQEILGGIGQGGGDPLESVEEDLQSLR
ncbi:hypothetical protein [Halobaculum sp. D14]|uniref:hypothetical protein n=1 Tax=Halobaculum sp. D14 TaxID=3421642 RepID=UPI003EC003A2